MYTGDPITPTTMTDLPGALQKTSATSELAKAIAQQTGLSAIKLDHLFNSYFNTVAAGVNIITYNMMQIADGETHRPDRSWTQNPLTNRFFKDADNYTMNQAMELQTESLQAYSAAMRAHNVGDQRTLDVIRADYWDEVQRGAKAAGYAQQMAAISRAINANQNKVAEGFTEEMRRNRDISLKAMRTRIAAKSIEMHNTHND
jgi:hypothetical protein